VSSMPRRALRFAFALLLLGAVCWFVIGFPAFRLPLALGFAVYAAALWRWPTLWLVAVPALLPVFDLAVWSGRFFFDEFDALVLLTAAILALRERSVVPPDPLDRKLIWTLALLVASYAISGSLRLLPVVPITADSFANYASPYNALRVAKGFVWALLLLPPLRRAAQTVEVRRLLAFGFLIGLFAVGLVAVYERWLFTGVLTWITDYRITASFSSMHTGDGPIDVFLAMTMPLIGVLFIDRRWIRLLPVTFALLALSGYTLVATESRGPAIGVVVAYGAGLVALFATRSHRRRVAGALVIGLGAAAFFATAGLPLLAETSLGQRFSQFAGDAAFRMGHWRAALSLRDRTLATELFGAGLGSFPALHQQRSILEPRATRYRFVATDSEHYLRQWPGESLYMGQAVTATRHATYQVGAQVRSPDPKATLTIAWCELWMLSSEHCTWDEFPMHTAGARWKTVTKTLRSVDIGYGRDVGGLFFERPTRLTFFVSGNPAAPDDVTGLTLKDSQGRELLRNGDFFHGGDNWFFTVDDHLQWHVKNLAVNILFDQGWLGLIAVGAFLALTIMVLFRQISGGDQLAAVILASLTGFLVTGVTVSTFDQPRLALAFYLLCFASLVPTAATRPVGNGAKQPQR